MGKKFGVIETKIGMIHMYPDRINIEHNSVLMDTKLQGLIEDGAEVIAWAIEKAFQAGIKSQQRKTREVLGII